MATRPLELVPELRGGDHAFQLKRLLDGDPPPPPEEHIRQLTLMRDVTLFGGHGDAGKSTLLFTVAVVTVVASVAGRLLFGSLPVYRPGPVVLVVPEDGEGIARHHVDAIAVGLELTDEEQAVLARDLYIVADTRRTNLMTDCAALGEMAEGIGAVALIGDPLGNLIGAESENDEHVAQLVCDNLRRYIAWRGVAVIVAGHLRKPARDAGSTSADANDFKGSVGWPNHARQVWTVSKPKGSDAITLRLVKANRLRTGIEHHLRLAIEAEPDNEAHWLSCRLTDANLGAASIALTAGVGRPLNLNEQAALRCLDDQHEPGRRVSWSEWVSTSALKADTLKSIKSRLLGAGLAHAHEAGTHRNGGKLYAYAITDRGRSALENGWVQHG
jgi:hypothetical protein